MGRLLGRHIPLERLDRALRSVSWTAGSFPEMGRRSGPAGWAGRALASAPRTTHCLPPSWAMCARLGAVLAWVGARSLGGQVRRRPHEVASLLIDWIDCAPPG
jgi:hypothetical protein